MIKLDKIFKAVSDGKELKESILDAPRKEYATWLVDENGKINKEVKSQIYAILRNWRNQINFPFELKAIEAKGSLLSKRYNEDTDLDIGVSTTMTKEQRDSIINIVPRGNKIVVDGKETEHPLDFYILAAGEEVPERNLDNIYDVANEKWIKRTEEYKNELPLSYVVQVSNFFINGCVIALENYNGDKVIYNFYKSIDPSSQEVSEDEKSDALIQKREDLKVDLDAMRIALHMISSFRQEVYGEVNNSPLEISINVKSDNPHVSINEQLVKMLEKFGIRQRLRESVDECEKILEEDKPHEEAK